MLTLILDEKTSHYYTEEEVIALCKKAWDASFDRNEASNEYLNGEITIEQYKSVPHCTEWLSIMFSNP